MPVVRGDVILGEAALQQSDQQLPQQRRLVPLRQQALLQVLPTADGTCDVLHAPVTIHGNKGDTPTERPDRNESEP